MTNNRILHKGLLVFKIIAGILSLWTLVCFLAGVNTVFSIICLMITLLFWYLGFRRCFWSTKKQDDYIRRYQTNIILKDLANQKKLARREEKRIKSTNIKCAKAYDKKIRHEKKANEKEQKKKIRKNKADEFLEEVALILVLIFCPKILLCILLLLCGFGVCIWI